MWAWSFEDEEHAYRFYNAYGGLIGFSVRKEWENKSKVDCKTILSRKYVCSREGFKKVSDYEASDAIKETRIGCLAQMIINRQANGKYTVKSFVKEHNHDLASPRSKHKLSSQRRISSAQATQIDSFWVPLFLVIVKIFA